MIISRFMCQKYLFGGEHCVEQCVECKPEEKKMSVSNEEKEPMYFVWEKTTRGMGAFCQPAMYRGMPKTGTGDKADKDRFVFVKKIEGDDIGKEFVTLINENPCPPKSV